MGDFPDFFRNFPDLSFASFSAYKINWTYKEYSQRGPGHNQGTFFFFFRKKLGTPGLGKPQVYLCARHQGNRTTGSGSEKFWEVSRGCLRWPMRQDQIKVPQQRGGTNKGVAHMVPNGSKTEKHKIPQKSKTLKIWRFHRRGLEGANCRRPI